MILTLTLNPSIDQHIFFERPLRSEDTNRAVSSVLTAGGKGLNVAKAARSIGAPVTALAVTAGGAGREWEELARGEGIRLEALRLTRGRTRINPFLYVRGVERYRVSEKGPQMDTDCLNKIIRRVIERRPPPRWAVLSGGLPQGLRADTYARLVRAFSSAGVACAVDADGEVLRAALAARPAVIKPNVFELERLDGRRLGTLGARLAAVRRARALGARCVVLSMAGEGALAVDERQAWLAVAPPVRVTNTSGAGDALLAGYVAALSRGWPADRAIALAVACGSAAVSGKGRSGALERGLVRALFKRIRVRSIPAT